VDDSHFKLLLLARPLGLNRRRLLDISRIRNRPECGIFWPLNCSKCEVCIFSSPERLGGRWLTSGSHLALVASEYSPLHGKNRFESGLTCSCKLRRLKKKKLNTNWDVSMLKLRRPGDGLFRLFCCIPCRQKKP
jgi:hypothetical protein